MTLLLQPVLFAGIQLKIHGRYRHDLKALFRSKNKIANGCRFRFDIVATIFMYPNSTSTHINIFKVYTQPNTLIHPYIYTQIYIPQRIHIHKCARECTKLHTDIHTDRSGAATITTVFFPIHRVYIYQIGLYCSFGNVKARHLAVIIVAVVAIHRRRRRRHSPFASLYFADFHFISLTLSFSPPTHSRIQCFSDV